MNDGLRNSGSRFRRGAVDTIRQAHLSEVEHGHTIYEPLEGTVREILGLGVLGKPRYAHDRAVRELVPRCGRGESSRLVAVVEDEDFFEGT